MSDFTVSASVDTFMVAANQAAMRTALGLGTLATQSATITDYLLSATATSTYAPLASPTFTGIVTIPSGASIAGYLTTAAAAAAYQPLDSDLTAIAALTTTTFGRSLLTQADASAARTTLGLGTIATAASTAYLLLAGGTTQSVTGITNFTNATASAGTTSGAVVVTGGLGVGGNIYTTGVFLANTGNLSFVGRGGVTATADGAFRFTNNSSNGLTSVVFGVNNSSWSGVFTNTTNGLRLLSGAGTSTFNDSATAAAGTLALQSVFSIAAPTFTGTNASTNTDSATLYIGGAPTASTNKTFTNTPTALWVASGRTFLGGEVAVGSALSILSSFSSSGNNTLQLKSGLTTNVFQVHGVSGGSVDEWVEIGADTNNGGWQINANGEGGYTPRSLTFKNGGTAVARVTDDNFFAFGNYTSGTTLADGYVEMKTISGQTVQLQCLLVP